jgi:hypothetical protein
VQLFGPSCLSKLGIGLATILVKGFPSCKRDAMAERSLDLSSLAKHYKGKWIIVSKDGCSVLCAAETLEDAIQGSKTYDGVLLKIPAFVKA